MQHKKNYAITRPEQIQINGVTPNALGKKARFSDKGLNPNQVVLEHRKKMEKKRG